MVGTEVEYISLKKATHLEKANHVLEKFIQYATHQDESAELHLLKQEGIFRLSGSSPQIDKLYAKIDKDPSTLAFESEEDFVLEPNNVTGFLKRYLLSTNLKWSDEAAAILRAELQRDTQNYDLAKVIQQLIAANHLEEAKMLHNLLHISRLVSLRAATNKMTVSNMFQTFSPTLVNLAQGDDSLAGRLALGAIVATQNNIDAMGLTTVNADGQATFGKTFNETYPMYTAQINQKLKEKYDSKPASDSKFTAFVNSTRDYITNVLIPVSKHFLTKTVPNFFTKTVPSFFKRFTGSKTKGEPLPDKMAVPAELLAAKQQAEAARAEAAKAKEWQAGQGPQAERNNEVVVGNKASVIANKEAPPDVRRSAILSQNEAEGAKQALKEGLKHFQALEAKGVTPPRPAVPPRERPIIAPRERPVVPPRGEKPTVPPRKGPTVPLAKEDKVERPVPPPRKIKPNKE